MRLLLSLKLTQLSNCDQLMTYLGPTLYFKMLPHFGREKKDTHAHRESLELAVRGSPKWCGSHRRGQGPRAAMMSHIQEAAGSQTGSSEHPLCAHQLQG